MLPGWYVSQSYPQRKLKWKEVQEKVDVALFGNNILKES